MSNETHECKGIFCFAEQRHGKMVPTIYELLHLAQNLNKELKEFVAAVLIGHQVSGYAQDLIEHGADQVYVLDHPAFEHFIDETYAKALAELICKVKAGKFLLPASIIGRSVASRTAILVNAGLTADATEFRIDPQTKMMHVTRPSFGGNLMATIICQRHCPEMATVRPMSFPRSEKQPGRKGDIVTFSIDPSQWASKTQFIQYEPDKGDEGIDISSAEKIVSGGRGLTKPEGFKMIEELAKALGGAVGASRPTVDAGWITYKHQVGLTGRTVRPKIYIACGISGQIQHLAGMSSSDVIIAINRDPEAPLMKMATLSVEGDLYEIIPLIIAEIKKAKN